MFSFWETHVQCSTSLLLADHYLSTKTSFEVWDPQTSNQSYQCWVCCWSTHY